MKAYIKPSIKVQPITEEHALLAASLTGEPEKDLGSTINSTSPVSGESALSKRQIIWDEEEDY